MGTDRAAPLSPAVERAIRQAANLAHSCGADQIEPVHLLVAVLLETESRGATLIARHGGDPEAIACRLLKPTQQASQIAPTPLPLSPTAQAALRHARSSMLVPRGLHASTDHLLLSLLRHDPTLQEQLRTSGVDVDQLLQTAASRTEQDTFHGSPIPLDDDLSKLSPQEQATSQSPPADPSPTSAHYQRKAQELLPLCVRIAYRLLESADACESAGTAAVDAARLLAVLLEAAAQQGIPAGAEPVQPAAEDASLAAARLWGLLHALATSPSIPPDMAERLAQGARLAESVAIQTSRSGQLRRRIHQARLYVLVGADCPLGVAETARQAVAGGADVIQLRLKRSTDRELLRIALEVGALVRKSGALFIMNDRPDVAILAGADGVHVGQEELPVAAVRRLVGPDRLIGLSTHTPEQAREAAELGADYIGVGPIFPSKTKQFDRLAGLALVEQVCPNSPIPAFAIGGIGPENIEAVLKAGARRVAVSHAVCAAPDPEAATRQLRAAIDKYTL